MAIDTEGDLHTSHRCSFYLQAAADGLASSMPGMDRALTRLVMRSFYVYPQAQRPLVLRWSGAARYDLRPGQHVSILLPSPGVFRAHAKLNSTRGCNFHASAFRQHTASGNTIGVSASAYVRCLGRLAELHGSPRIGQSLFSCTLAARLECSSLGPLPRTLARVDLSYYLGDREKRGALDGTTAAY